MMRALLLLAGLWLLPLPAAAQDCSATAPQSAMNDCAGQGLARADAALNATYQQIMGRLRQAAPAQQALREAQRAWVRFRDGECDFATIGTEGGSIRPMLVAQCRQGLTEQRLAQLRRYLNCREGDLDCPVPAAR